MAPTCSVEAHALLTEHGETLIAVATASLEEGLRSDRPLDVDPAAYPPKLDDHHATFVTLKRAGNLRGCVGSARAWRSLLADVADNAYRAGFRDSRFKPLRPQEFPGLDLSISLLSAPEPFPVASEEELIERLRPGTDGLVLKDGRRTALFLPAVWEDVSEPSVFLAHLKRKAGLAPDHWSETIAFSRFTSASVSGKTGPLKGSNR